MYTSVLGRQRTPATYILILISRAHMLGLMKCDLQLLADNSFCNLKADIECRSC